MRSQDSEQSVDDSIDDDSTPELIVKIRFHSMDTDSPSCLQVEGSHQEGQSRGGGDCAAVVAADWQWERVATPDGVSLLHTLSAKDVLDIVDTGSTPKAEELSDEQGGHMREQQ